MVRLILALVFLVFALLKFVADGVKDLSSSYDKTPAALTDRSKQAIGACSELSVEGVSGNAVDDQINGNIEDGADESPAVSIPPTAPSLSTKSVEVPPSEPWWLMRVLPIVGCFGGVLGGLSGMNGPPFVLMVAFFGLHKRISRSVFPMGQLPEAWCVRLPALIALGHVKATDAHLYVLNAVLSQIGITLGNILAPKVSQAMFERLLLGFIILASLSILGILRGHPRAVIALCCVAFVLGSRLAISVWRERSKRQS